MVALLEATGLGKRYIGGPMPVEALSGVSFRVAAGEFVAVVGRSGSGKSTLMSIIGLLDRPDTGTYHFNGRDVSNLRDEARSAIRRHEVGFIFQLPMLLPRSTALQNVELPLVYAGIARGERRRRAHEALERVGLAHRLDHRPQQLSGGEQQRVAFARAIVNEPSLILADEPTGSLDSVTAEGILGIFDNLNRDGRTVLVVTHAVDVAAHARRRITLHDGRVIADECDPPMVVDSP